MAERKPRELSDRLFSITDQTPYSFNCAGIQITANGRTLEQTSLLSINVSSGGRSLDKATFAVRLNSTVEKQRLFDGVQEIEVFGPKYAPGERSFGGGRCLFWGETSGAKLDLGDEQTIIVEAQQAPWHFGKYVEGMWELNPNTGAKQLLVADLVFNPTQRAYETLNKKSSGLVRGNMAAQTGGRGSYSLFLDPARVHTSEARELATGGVPEKASRNTTEAKFLASDKKWTLPEIVYYLCWTCNEDEKNFYNPSRNDLREVLDTNENLVHDLTIPVGTYLPAALDAVLNTYGYSWKILYLGVGQRRIGIFRRGVGPQKKVYWQPSSAADLIPAKTNADAAQFGIGWQSLVNRVRVLGNNKLWEATWELKRAWSADYDAASEDNLSSATPTWNTSTTYHRVWRDWVLNESGDYIGVRSDFTQAYDFKTIFGFDTVPRRRRFWPCITLDADRLPLGRNGYVVEYSADAGENWSPIDQLQDSSFEVLANECGIRFTGVLPPDELRTAGTDGANARIRITASVYDDERIDQESLRAPKSAQPLPVRYVVDKSSDYHFRRVHTSSQFYSKVSKGTLQSSQVDDTTRADVLAKRISQAWDQLDVTGTINVPYFISSDDYQIGDCITKIEGREIDLDIRNAYEARHPQIVGITYNYQTQTQTLALETYRDTRFV